MEHNAHATELVMDRTASGVLGSALHWGKSASGNNLYLASTHLHRTAMRVQFSHFSPWAHAKLLSANEDLYSPNGLVHHRGVRFFERTPDFSKHLNLSPLYPVVPVATAVSNLFCRCSISSKMIDHAIQFAPNNRGRLLKRLCVLKQTSPVL